MGATVVCKYENDRYQKVHLVHLKLLTIIRLKLFFPNIFELWTNMWVLDVERKLNLASYFSNFKWRFFCVSFGYFWSTKIKANIFFEKSWYLSPIKKFLVTCLWYRKILTRILANYCSQTSMISINIVFYSLLFDALLRIFRKEAHMLHLKMKSGNP